ncbi:unnamed protein product, partial [Mesorhabditis spiculigera]
MWLLLLSVLLLSQYSQCSPIELLVTHETEEPQQKAPDQLIFVNALWRHGNRAPDRLSNNTLSWVPSKP